MTDLLVSATRMNVISLVILMVFFAAAAWIDVKSSRIPNVLVVTGAIVGIAFSLAPGGIGLREMVLGLAIGFVLLLPFYALGIMGAGDVNLMAMAGRLSSGSVSSLFSPAESCLR